MKSFFGLKSKVSYSNFSGFLKAMNLPCSYLIVLILRRLIFNKIVPGLDKMIWVLGIY